MAKEEITSDVRKYVNWMKIKAQHIKIYDFSSKLLFGGKHITLNADIWKFKSLKVNDISLNFKKQEKKQIKF